MHAASASIGLLWVNYHYPPIERVVFFPSRFFYYLLEQLLPYPKKWWFSSGPLETVNNKERIAKSHLQSKLQFQNCPLSQVWVGLGCKSGKGALHVSPPTRVELNRRPGLSIAATRPGSKSSHKRHNGWTKLQLGVASKEERKQMN